jgi:stage II sporulation protein M
MKKIKKSVKEKIKKHSVKKIKDKFSLKEEYIKSWRYLGESKKFIFWIIGIFFLLVILGFLIPPSAGLYNLIMDKLKEIVQKTQGMNTFELITFIFFNNLQTSFSGMIFGVLFGIIPIMVTIINGYLVGFVSAMSVDSKGFSSLLSLLPHGIFELPAVFISLGLGLKFGSFIFEKDKINSFREFFWNSIRVFILIVIPLLIIAAIIEGSLIVLLA